MHKLMEYICDEIDELERKAEGGKLSMAEIQYLDTLAHTKKNLLKADEMYEEGEYSMDGMSYARGRRGNVRRDSMGRYSRDESGMIHKLRTMMDDAPDDRTRMEFQRFIQKLER